MSPNIWKINFTSHSFWEPFPHMEPTATLILPAEIVNYNSTAHGDRNLWRVLPQTNSVLIWVCDEHFTPCPCKHVFFPFQSWRTIGILSIFLNILFRFALERQTCYHFYLWLPHFISPINNHHMEKILKKTLPIPFFLCVLSPLSFVLAFTLKQVILYNIAPQQYQHTAVCFLFQSCVPLRQCDLPIASTFHFCPPFLTLMSAQSQCKKSSQPLLQLPLPWAEVLQAASCPWSFEHWILILTP